MTLLTLGRFEIAVFSPAATLKSDPSKTRYVSVSVLEIYLTVEILRVFECEDWLQKSHGQRPGSMP